MTTRNELIQLIDDLPDAEQAELVERLKLQRRTEFATSRSASSGEGEPRATASWDKIGPAAFGAAVLVAFTAGSVGGQAGPLLAAIGALVGLLIGSFVDRRLASIQPSPAARRRRAPGLIIHRIVCSCGGSLAFCTFTAYDVRDG